MAYAEVSIYTRALVCLRSITQEDQQLVCQEGMQQLKREVCLLGKLRVTIPVVNTAAKHWRRRRKMGFEQVDQSVVAICVIAMQLHFGRGARLQRLCRGVDSTQKYKPGMGWVFKV